MKRKVNRVGQNTLTVSLPSKWVASSGIKPGDEIDIDEIAGSLVIGARAVDAKKNRVELDISGLDRTSILIALRAAYRAGYDEIGLKFKSQFVMHHRTGKNIKTLSAIHSEVNRLIGAQIISEGEHSCLIKDFSANLDQEFEPTVRRVFLLILQAADDLVKGMKEGDAYLISSIEEKQDTITKFISYCLRMINKGAIKNDVVKNAVYYQTLSSLDRLVDIYKYVGRDFIPQFNRKISKSAITAIEDINSCLRMFYELFYKFENSRASDFIVKRDMIKEDLVSKLKSLSKEELIMLYYLEQVLEILWGLVLARRCLETK